MSKENVIKLREITGAGVSDCQAALKESGDDIEKAIEVLRKKGALKAAKKLAERTAKEGLVGSYIHATGRAGCLIQVSCETDFVARTEEFKELVHDLAMHVTAFSPEYLRPEDIPAEVLDKEKEIYIEQLKKEGKPEQVIPKILEGKLEKFYGEVCLLNQPFIKDDKISVKEHIDQKIAKTGEKIEVVRFAKFNV